MDQAENRHHGRGACYTTISRMKEVGDMSAMQFLLYMGWPAITCLVLGLGLMIYEMFTPGFAVPGITGLILLALSVVLTAVPFHRR